MKYWIKVRFSPMRTIGTFLLLSFACCFAIFFFYALRLWPLLNTTHEIPTTIKPLKQMGQVDANQILAVSNEEIKFSLMQDAITATLSATSADWGDYDNDGDLDLVIGTGTIYSNLNIRRRNQIYRNDNGKFHLVWESPIVVSTRDVAWGDFDGDGDLDLATGAQDGVRIYRNLGVQPDGRLNLQQVWHSAEKLPQTADDSVQSIAWADYEGDGKLDLAVGNGIIEVDFSSANPIIRGQSNRLYRNEGHLDGDPIFAVVNFTSISDATTSVAWGDYDGDNRPDLVVGNGPTFQNQSSLLYHNDDGRLVLAPSNFFVPLDPTMSVAWADYDNDGNLDLAVVNASLFGSQANRIYRNDRRPGDGSTPRFNRINLPKQGGETSTSVAWADYNGDGYLDLAIGNAALLATEMRGGRNWLYQYENGTFRLVWSSDEVDDTLDVAWADYDGDGAPDLIAANAELDVGQPARLYRNDAVFLSPSVDVSNFLDWSLDVAWGDYNGDGKLDLAVANRLRPGSQSSRVYHNVGVEGDGGAPLFQVVWNSAEAFPETANDSATSIAWGDYDGDGRLDLLVGGGDVDPHSQEPINHSERLFRNISVSQSVTPQFELVWSSPPDLSDATASVAWGDYDGDGDLDFAIGNGLFGDQSSRIYRNDSVSIDGVLLTTTFTPVWSFPPAKTVRIAWGDFDGDGDLDLAMANREQPNRIYRNQGLTNDNLPIFELAWESEESDDSFGIAWGDFDGDGDLDLAVANRGPNRLYRNERGILTRSAVWSSIEADISTSIAWGDYDNDGDLDLVVGNGGFYPNTPIKRPNHLYRNDQGTLTTRAVWLSNDQESTTSLAWGDVDGDGDLDLLASNAGQADRLYVNQRDGRKNRNPAPLVRIVRPSPPANANLFSSAEIWSTPIIPLTYTLSHPHNLPVRSVQVDCSLDGEGGEWLPAVPATGTQTANVATSVDGETHVYYWNVGASGVFGQSDQVVCRLQAIPSIVTRTYQIPGPYLYGSYASTTFPFRVRGTQIQVVDDTGDSVADAVVYRIPAGQSSSDAPIGNDAAAFHTNAQGYLQGRGELKLGDQLLALAPVALPVTYTQRYSDTIRLYYTNGIITNEGVRTWISNTQSVTVTQPGVQILQVRQEHPLLLFDVEVSLEWDASKEPRYLDQLVADLQETSRYLYDFTNGQVALGRVRVAQDADDWANAHVVVHATNRLRPYAVIGGAVITVTADFSPTVPITYGPGQVHIGAVWNRYNDINPNPGIDWPLILAHELSHYLFGLEDTYLGLEMPPEIGETVLVNISTCPSAMGDVYNPNHTEFIFSDTEWQAYCATTLSNIELQRNEWRTITGWFPWLVAPIQTITGPATQPFAFTDIQILLPITPTHVLANQAFYLDYQGAVTSTSEARVFLLRDDNSDTVWDYIYDLGSAVGDQKLLRAHGVQPGDRLCVFDRPRRQAGCEVVREGDDRITLTVQNDWAPVVQVSLANSTTFTISVTNALAPATDFGLQARIFPEYGTELASTALSLENGVYSGTLQINEPALAGHLYIWDATNTREAIVAYSIGGNPGNTRSAGGGFTRAGGGNTRSAGGGGFRGAGGNTRSAGGGGVHQGDAPAVSPDGKLIFFATEDLSLAEGQFYTVQDMAGLPPLPAGKTAIGQGYNLAATGFPSTTNPLTGSVSIQYVALDVLTERADENELTLHFWDGLQWRALPTYRDPFFNLVSARSQGPGVYALLAGITTPQLISVTPAIANNDVDTLLTISGKGFLAPVAVSLVAPTATYTLPVLSVNPLQITALVTATVAPNEYQVVVVNRNEPGGGARTPVAGRFSLFVASTDCFYDFFDSGVAKWVRSGDWDIVGLMEGERAMTDSPARPYKDAGDYDTGSHTRYTTSITSTPFGLAGCASNPGLVFVHDYTLARSSAGDDWAVVEISTDGGIEWTQLISFTGGGIFGDGVVESADAASEWRDVVWKMQEISLAAYTNAPELQLRFSLVVNNDRVTSRGWILKEVNVRSGVLVDSHTPTNEEERPEPAPDDSRLFLPLVTN